MSGVAQSWERRGIYTINPGLQLTTRVGIKEGGTLHIHKVKKSPLKVEELTPPKISTGMK